MKTRANNRLLYIFSPMLLAGLAIALMGCGEMAMAPKPELPVSVSPGWSQKSFAKAQPVAGLPAGVRAQCWKAEYEGSGAAEIWICGFNGEGSAFDAAQRYPAGADRVKFQAGKYLAVVHWSGGSKADVTALVRAIQKSLGAR